MHTGTLRKLALALTFWLALHTSSLHAQILPVGPYGSNPITFGVDVNGLISDTGTYGTGTLSLSGAGTRMFWYPGKAAFRAGYVSSTQWDNANIGHYSVALGFNTTASGNYSTAFGANTVASGTGSTAFGSSTLASKIGATAFGYGTKASGYGATAFGSFSTASGNYSTVAGVGTTASGDYSTALGDQTTASGNYSIALGCASTASGTYSTASGLYANASAYASFVVGVYNVGGSSPTTWVASDPLFEVGNGGSDANGNGNPAINGTSDAFVVYKNGSARFSGPVTVPQSGDIPMYTGN